MKNRNKIITSLALSAGVIATFGASYALYISKTGAKDKEITIGSVTSKGETTGTLSYTFGNAVTKFYDSAGTTEDWVSGDDIELNPTYNKVQITIPLSFKYDSEYKGAEQDYILGTLGVSATIDSKIGALGTTKLSAKLTGYDTNYSGGYFAAHKQGPLFNGNNDNTSSFTASDGKYSLSDYISTAIDTSSISVVIEIDFSESITDATFLDIADLDSAYSVNLTWGKYDPAVKKDPLLTDGIYMVGDMNAWKTDSENLFEEYALVPNLAKTDNSSSVEWVYKGLTGVNQVKVYDTSLEGDNRWISAKNECPYKAEGGNAILTYSETKTSYTVTYARNDGGFWVA